MSTSARRDRYQCSALVGTDPETSHWTAMWDVPWGKSPVAEAEETIREFETISKVSIYRNSRFVRYVHAPLKAVCA